MPWPPDEGELIVNGPSTIRILEDIDLALMPINGLSSRPQGNRQEVMDAAQAAELTALLRPRPAVPIHYAYTSGAIGDRILVKLDRNHPEHAAAPAREHRPPLLAPLHRPMARGRYQHPRDRQAPKVSRTSADQPLLPSRQPSSPHRRSGTRSPPTRQPGPQPAAVPKDLAAS